jgi:hypothetical protein
MLALLPLLAVIDPGVGAKLLGWSSDGQYLAWTSSEVASSFPKHYFYMKGDDRVDVADPDKLAPADRAKLQEEEGGMMGESPTTDEIVDYAVVHDARSGADQTFVLTYKAASKVGKATGTLKKKYAGLPDAAAFDAWKKQHPLAKTPGKKSAKGTAAVDVAFASTDGEAKPEKPTWAKSSISWSVEASATVTLATACGKDRASEAIAQEIAAMYVPHWTATPIWDPSGHRVAFVLEEAVAKTMRGPDGGRLQYVIVPCGTRVDVVAPAGLEAATGPVADAVEKAGFTVVSIGTAKAARTQTVVYADAAHIDVAAKLAAALPGGATVDKLTWKPKADIVVAVGDSAK